jgi:phospholipid/cholesterol/gamma-HCH transport system permease protein
MTTKTQELLDTVGGNAILGQQIWREMFQRPMYLHLWVIQMQNVGVRSLPLTFVVAISVGMVMALQFGIGLEKFGGTLYIPKIVSVSIIRELGPVFASLMFAARVGAGITSEVASMVVTQQIDAIRALGTSPIKKIVIPRVMACLITLPLLCVFANTIGVMGGMFVGSMDLGLDSGFYFQKIRSSVTLADYFSGLGKSFFFAMFVAIPSCYFGLNVTKGTRGVGQATTKAVVVSSILILAGDYFLTKLFWIFESWK